MVSLWHFHYKIYFCFSHSIKSIYISDVVYDNRIIPYLVLTLKKILYSNLHKSVPTCAYLASTIRNEDTRDQFLITLSKYVDYYGSVSETSGTHYLYIVQFKKPFENKLFMVQILKVLSISNLFIIQA